MFKTYLKVIFLAVFCALNASIAHSISLLRDPDIEHGLQQLAAPILRAAKLKSDSVKVWVVNDMGLNAFVIDHTHIFLHAGLVLKLKSAAQLQSVIAHEAAHISNGHISRRLANARRAKMATSFGVLVAAAAVGAGHTDAGLGLALGTTGSVNRILLAHNRIEESAADQSALRFMNAAKIDPVAMAEVFELFIGQSNLSEEYQDPYTRSHPLNRDRIRIVNAYAANATSYLPDAAQAYWFSRIQGKLSGFLRAPQWTMRRATGSSDVDLMRRAIAEHRSGRSSSAQKTMAQLIATHPNDAFYRELQGQILLESRKFSTATKAYASAADLAPSNALILGGYGRSLLARNIKNSNTQALKILQKARNLDSRDARILRDIGTAYARSGQQGQAVLAIAERYALKGNMKNAAIQAKRAEGLLPRGSAAWQRAQDILDAVKTP
ncbi:M48 family metalloprotease [uncultured Planktomarina sp.]|uniref:M48 family metalloprotease n=1 Tax=uncultured Planktomarina sp. TaxID=1538529 RepID=UPI00326121CB